MNAFSPQNQASARDLNSQATAAIAALQQFVPISLAGFQSLDTNALAQFAHSQSLMLGGGNRSDDDHQGSTGTKHHHSSRAGSSGNANNNPATPSSANGNASTARSRLMFDPLSELPILEKWFEDNPREFSAS
jgi:hypothetical protein